MKSKKLSAPQLYGLYCDTQLEEYIIRIQTPPWWTSPEEAANAPLRFKFPKGKILVELDAQHHAEISEDEWWLYRISRLKDSAKDKGMVDVSDYEPCDISLSDLHEVINASYEGVHFDVLSLCDLSYSIYLS
ncbi:hypothetical protein [Ethanoligenens sp.]|uniref:hypothetical protein n=1 Tax=Ethanoligenens sp. TaxID=2099655 RepID=UPI0039EBCE83